MVGPGYLRSVDDVDVGRVGASYFDVVQNSNMRRLLQMLLVLREVHVEVQEEKQDRQPTERKEMLSPQESVRRPVRRVSPEGETKTQEEIMVSKPEDVRVLRMRPVDTEELLHSAKPLLFVVLYDQKVHIDYVLLRSDRG
jgi:hypothetical protein